MTFASAMAAVAGRNFDLEALEGLAKAALDEGEEEQALPTLEKAAGSHRSARLFQWKGLLERSLDEHQLALQSFGHAETLEPDNASIAHGYARVALEAGVGAEGLFERALALSPSDSSILFGLIAARLAAGHGDQGEAELDAILARAPLWIEGHVQLAQLRSMLGRPSEADASYHRALSAAPAEPRLWTALLDLQVKQEKFPQIGETALAARANSVPAGLLLPFEAVAAAELGRLADADRLFAEVEAVKGPPLTVWRIRHLLRSGRASEAVPLIDAALAGPEKPAVWPYASVAWRMTGDPRAAWLEEDEGLISVIDLENSLPLEELAPVLRSLHVAKGEYLDQSVRGGTQTDGPLFSRVESPIGETRASVIAAVRKYLAQLPPIRADHPLLAPRRDRRIRFSGSWSVRLSAPGYHVSHVHPQGWISSALYVAVPDSVTTGMGRAGWLQIGRPPQSLETGLEAKRLIEPRPGRLVLFPSWMWHGTLPFESGERLTVAFDVAMPR